MTTNYMLETLIINQKLGLSSIIDENLVNTFLEFEREKH